MDVIDVLLSLLAAEGAERLLLLVIVARVLCCCWTGRSWGCASMLVFSAAVVVAGFCVMGLFCFAADVAVA